MKKAKPVKISSAIPVSTSAASTSTTAPVGDPSTSSPVSAATVSTTLAVPTEPPDIVIPSPPAGFTPVTLLMYRGYFPKADQVSAAQGAVVELQSNGTFDATFGAGATSSANLLSVLTYALGWSQMRTQAEVLLEYIRSNEAVTWKAAFTELDQLDAIYQIVKVRNFGLVEGFPALGRLLAVPKVITKRAHQTRARNAKAKAEAAQAAAQTQSTGATTAPAANATGATSAVPANGGATATK